MVVLSVPGSPMLGAIAAASAHGLTDLQRPPAELLPYGLVLVPCPSELVTPVFLLLSVQHFSRDVGYSSSLLLHASFAMLSLLWPSVAWGVFGVFYCLVHVPNHLAEHLGKVDRRLLAGICAAAALFASFVDGASTFFVTDWMQLGVCSHILVDELHGRGAVDGACTACDEQGALQTASLG